jgi:DNA-binding MarR family transcriptional regulator
MHIPKLENAGLITAKLSRFVREGQNPNIKKRSIVDKKKLRRFREELRKFERKLEILKDNSCSPGVSLPQCHILLEIEILGKTTGAALSRRLGLDPSTLSRTIDGLVNIGLIQRTPHPEDRRVIRLYLTEQGKRTCDNMNRNNDAFFRKVFSSIPKSEQDRVIRSFELFVSALVEEDFPSSKAGA